MEIENQISNDVENKNSEGNQLEMQKNNNLDTKIVTEENQKSFLNSALGNAISNGVDIGIRLLCPNLIEDQLINLKNNLLKYGLSEGISKTIDSAIDVGRSAIGVVTGKFENISQAQNVIKNGGILDNISDLIDVALTKATKVGVINKNISNLIRQGKNAILNNVEKNIENTFTSQIKSLEYLGKYMNNWTKFYNSKDFSGMEREYSKIKKELKQLMPLEETFIKARQIENLHTLIKNNGQDFNISQEALQLAEKL